MASASVVSLAHVALVLWPGLLPLPGQPRATARCCALPLARG